MDGKELFALTTASAGGLVILFKHVLQLLYTSHGDIILLLHHPK